MYLYGKDYNAFDKDERWGSKSKHPPMFIKPHQFKPVLHWTITALCSKHPPMKEHDFKQIVAKI
jgi:hypothetical protein